jgi:hypothetical protein
MVARNFRIPRTAVAFALAAGMAFIAAGSAFADDGTSVLVSAGALTISNPLVADFTDVAMNGANQTTTAALDLFTVVDARGTGAGWHVTAQATQFAGGGFTMPAGSLSMSAPAVTAGTGTTAAAPSVTVAGTLDNVGALQIASAALEAGLGTYNFSATTLSLVVPASVKAATYASTVTFSIVTAP